MLFVLVFLVIKLFIEKKKIQKTFRYTQFDHTFNIRVWSYIYYFDTLLPEFSSFTGNKELVFK